MGACKLFCATHNLQPRQKYNVGLAAASYLERGEKQSIQTPQELTKDRTKCQKHNHSSHANSTCAPTSLLERL